MNNFAIYSRPLARIRCLKPLLPTVCLSAFGNNLKTRRYNTTTTKLPLAFAFDIVRTRLLHRRKEQSINSDYRFRTVFLSEERMRFLLRDAPSKYWKGITFSGSGLLQPFCTIEADFLQENSIHPCAYLSDNRLGKGFNVSLVANEWWRCR